MFVMPSQLSVEFMWATVGHGTKSSGPRKKCVRIFPFSAAVALPVERRAAAAPPDRAIHSIRLGPPMRHTAPHGAMSVSRTARSTIDMSRSVARFAELNSPHQIKESAAPILSQGLPV